MPHSYPTIVIERFNEAHLDGVTALYSEPSVAAQTLQMPYQSRELWRQRLAQRVDNERQVSLVALHQGAVIGSCSLEQFSRVRRAHCAGIGMGVSPAWQRQGIGSRLLAAVLEVADNWMNLRRVELTVYADNQAAIGLYQKFGFETEGQLRDYAIRGGQYVDVLSMARLRTMP
ncbi:GNAT family N-acetyltransferase [Pseudomonas sp. Fl5BN2]|uniref:GNAT family N-acetyltransferase n=1 Tax=unclassified Pseudomonas TaxID=196821 RepID=UPI001376E9C0|nr:MULTISPECIES: GNAT family N-acetyltransferase [unclassified Pseudomonas]NBF02160.1 GNAT family N-acetyltransferase [Pseudomonas sp. Fl5BN2]NBF07902.1 GNAT family N-acetyltransferase [Pseudomonas sp. Fl4BN1]